MFFLGFSFWVQEKIMRQCFFLLVVRTSLMFLHRGCRWDSDLVKR